MRAAISVSRAELEGPVDEMALVVGSISMLRSVKVSSDSILACIRTVAEPERCVDYGEVVIRFGRIYVVVAREIVGSMQKGHG